MKFVQKLIDDTNNGDWDFKWKYSDGSQTYTFNQPKHYLSGLNFSLTANKKLLIFPNGYGLETTLLENLKKAIDVSLERTVDESMRLYVEGKEMTQEQEDLAAEQEALKAANKPDEKKEPQDKKKTENRSR